MFLFHNCRSSQNARERFGMNSRAGSRSSLNSSVMIPNLQLFGSAILQSRAERGPVPASPEVWKRSVTRGGPTSRFCERIEN